MDRHKLKNPALFFCLCGGLFAQGPSFRGVESVNTYKNAAYCADSSVSANTITCSTAVGFVGYTGGQTVDLLLANSVTGAATININSLGTKAVTYNGSTAMATGIMSAGGTYRLQYDATEFVLQGSVNTSTGAVPGSPVNSVQYNNAGAFGGTAQVLWNPTYNYLEVGNATPSPNADPWNDYGYNFWITSNQFTGLGIYASGESGSEITFFNSGGTVGADTPVVPGDQLASINESGFANGNQSLAGELYGDVVSVATNCAAGGNCVAGRWEIDVTNPNSAPNGGHTSFMNLQGNGYLHAGPHLVGGVGSALFTDTDSTLTIEDQSWYGVTTHIVRAGPNQAAAVGPLVFTGSGLNDASSSGTYTGGAQNTYTVIIDATGTPDTFKWQKNSGAFTTGVAVTGTAQTITDGVHVTFVSTTGHTLADQWIATGFYNVDLMQWQDASKSVLSRITDTGGYSGPTITTTGTNFASLGTPANGTQEYCSDCQVTSSIDNTCTSTGSGAQAFRINGVWKCQQ